MASFEIGILFIFILAPKLLCLQIWFKSDINPSEISIIEVEKLLIDFLILFLEMELKIY